MAAVGNSGVHSTSPDAMVVFYPYDVESTRSIKSKSASEFMKNKPLTITKDIMQISTSKGKGSVGTFSIVLSSNQAYKGRLNPGSWCLIYLSTQPLDEKDGSSVESGLKMVGIVRSIRRQEAIAPSGHKMVRYVISGEDFQSIFNTPVYLNANLAAGSTNPISLAIEAALTIRGKSKGKFTPRFNIETLIDVLVGPINNSVSSRNKIDKKTAKLAVSGGWTPIRVPSEMTKRVLGQEAQDNYFTSMVTFFLQRNLIGESVDIPEVGGVVPVWGLLHQYCNNILNEIYCDLLPVSIAGENKAKLIPSFVLRAIPFSTEKIHGSCIKFLDAQEAKTPVALSIKNGRTRVEVPVTANEGVNFYISKKIQEHEILGLNSGKSDAERFNMFLVVPNMVAGHREAENLLLTQAIQKSGGINHFLDTNSLQRYGLKPYITYSQYFLDRNKNLNINIFNSIVRDMWQDAYLYENGMVVLAGTQEHVPVGTNIKFEQRDWIAHVEKVEHHYSVAGDGEKEYKTTISFVRLQTVKGEPVDATENISKIVDGETLTGRQGEWDRGLSRGAKK